MRRPAIQVLAANTRGNTGDRACLPHAYFAMGDVITTYIGCRSRRESRHSLLIVGGGGVYGHEPTERPLARTLRLHRGPAVVWGAGVNGAGDYPDMSRYDIVGVRDTGVPFDYVPCVSCMHSFLDDPPEPTRDVVVYSGAIGLEPNGRAHARCEEDLTVEGAMNFLASGRIVVTSSYHGWYWSMLMGRAVLLVNDGGNKKFWRMDSRPMRATPDDWEEQLAKVQTMTKESLDTIRTIARQRLQCYRNANTTFYRKLCARYGLPIISGVRSDKPMVEPA